VAILRWIPKGTEHIDHTEHSSLSVVRGFDELSPAARERAVIGDIAENGKYVHRWGVHLGGDDDRPHEIFALLCTSV
jgi:hypothetical protein